VLRLLDAWQITPFFFRVTWSVILRAIPPPAPGPASAATVLALYHLDVFRHYP